MKKIKILQIAACILLISAALLLMWPQSNIIQSDTLWHIKNGEWIINNGSIPTNDYFSYHENLNFIAHEWLFDILISYISHGGVPAVTLFAILSVTAGFCYVIFRTKNPAQWLCNAFIVFFMTLAGFHKGIMAIPDTIGAVVMVVLGNNLVNQERSLKKKLVINTAGSIFLVNYQGGMMSAALVQCLFLAWMPTVIDLIKKQNPKSDIKNAALLTLSAFTGSLINPYGINVYKYGLMMGTEAAAYVTDWQPYSFPGAVTVILFLIVIVTAVYGNYVSNSGFKFHPRYLCLFFYICIMFTYRRGVNLCLYAIVLFAGRDIYFATVHILSKTAHLKVMHIISAFIAGILAFISIIGGLINLSVPNKSIREYINAEYVNPEMEEYLKGRKIFNITNNSGYLIYLDIPVFMDGRIDVYTPEYDNPDIFMEGLKALHSNKQMNELSDKYGFDTLVLDLNSTTTGIFLASPDWESNYYSENIIIFERKKEKKE